MRVRRLMKAHACRSIAISRGAVIRRKDERTAVERFNLHWCPDRLELGRENVERVRVASGLNCCAREVLGHVDSTVTVAGEDVQDLMIIAIECRFRPPDRLPQRIGWLFGKGSGYIVYEMNGLAREMGLGRRTTPVPSPQRDRLAEAFVRTINRNDVWVSPLPDARNVLESSSLWLE
jgi:putative transposase